MKKNILSVMILSTALATGFSAYAGNLGVDRTILQMKNDTVIAPMVPLSTFDFGHQRMINTKYSANDISIYDQSDAARLDSEARQKFIALAGIDIATATPGVTGLPTVRDPADNSELALVVPFAIGYDGKYNVLYDSKGNSKNNGKWTIRNNSIIMQFRKAGQFTTGALAGQFYKAGDILSYGYSVHLRTDKNWSVYPDARDSFIVYTTRPGQTLLNSKNRSEVHASLQYLSESDGKIGYGSDNTYVEVTGPAGDGQKTRSITHHPITFFDEDNQ